MLKRHPMRKEKLLGRLKNLYLLELFNAFFLPCVFLNYCYTHNESVGLNSVIALTLNGILLLEGSYLWFHISRQVTTANSNDVRGAFKKLKALNLGLIALAITFILFNPFKGKWDMYGAIIFVSLAVLEHINYFEFQLMYDNQNDIRYLINYRRLKKSKLKRLMTK